MSLLNQHHFLYPETHLDPGVSDKGMWTVVKDYTYKKQNKNKNLFHKMAESIELSALK